MKPQYLSELPDIFDEWYEAEQEPSPAREVLGFLCLVLCVGALGVALWFLSGPPFLPSLPPDFAYLRELMASTELPEEDVVYFASLVGWAVFGYLAGSAAIRTPLTMVFLLTDRATWSAAAMRLSDAVTLPVVRRAIDGALVGAVVVSLWLRERPIAEADGGATAVTAIAMRESGLAAQHGPAPTLPPALQREDEKEGGQYITYTVAPGDSLWEVARQIYGDGSYYRLIFDANQGRVMPTGEAFTDVRLIRPGWVLDVPLPAHNVQASDGHVLYRVQAGDSLWRIAERLLGDGFRWIEIWRLNEGREMAGGSRFVKPDLIYPGWLLELPLEVKTGDQRPQPAPDEAPVEPPAPTATPTSEPLEPLGQVEPAEPTAVSPQPQDGGGRGISPPLPGRDELLATAAGLLTAGGVVLAVRALRRRTTDRGLRVVQADRRGKRPYGDVGRVILAGKALLASLLEIGFDDVRLVTARESERYTEFLMECAPGDADALAHSKYELGRRLACRVDADAYEDDATHVYVKLSSFQRLAGLLAAETSPEVEPLLVPVGASDGIHYLNLALGGTLLTGNAHETKALINAWVATLQATHRADQLTLLLSADLEARVEGPPARAREDRLDGAVRRPARQLAWELKDAVVARESEGNAGAVVPTVAFVGVSEAWESENFDLETLLQHGSQQGVHVVVVSEDPEAGTGLSLAARIAFGALVEPADGEEPERSPRGSGGPGNLTLTVGRREPLVLEPIAVRGQRLPYIASPSTNEAEELDIDWPRPPIPSGLEVDSDVAEHEAEAARDADSGSANGNEPELLTYSDAYVPTEHASEEGELWSSEEEAAVESEATSSVATPLFKVQCFGGFKVTRADGERVTWRIQKARELFAYLIARKGEPVLREEVGEALWPDGLPEQVEHLLSNAAYQLRRAFTAATEADVQVLSAAAQRYYLQWELFRVDADSFTGHLRRAEELDGSDALVEYERALAIYQGEFLAGEPFEWAGPARHDFQRRFQTAAHAAARLALDRRDPTRALEFYKAVLTQDPLDEEAARGAMRCYGKLADLTGVRKVYKVLCEALRREFEDTAEPLPETKALYEELVRGPV